MTQKYILTGGPGSGKSSIILELEARGEYIVREAAEDVIRRTQAKGIERPWENPNFQRDILRLQIQREKAIPAGVERAFIDRGILDGLAYTTPGTEISREIQREARTYAGVFLIKNLGQTQTNKVRREDQEAALKIESGLREIYDLAGYRIMAIPACPVEQRAEAILEIINRGVELR